MVFRHYFVGLMLFLGAVPVVNAQVTGLSIADTSEPAGKGRISIMGITIHGENSSLYGGRLAYGIGERLLLFTDIGSYDTEYADAETMGQFGVRYTLPVDLPFDLAVRGTAIPYVASYEHYVELTLNLLASRYLDADSNWAVYGSLGAVHQQWELELALDPVQAAQLGQDTYVDKGDDAKFSAVLGATRKLPGAFRLFAEVAHVDDFFWCAGLRFDIK